MNTGRRTTLGFGREATWGTPVAPTIFVDAGRTFSIDQGRIKAANNFGHLAGLPADKGRLRVSANINSIEARPEITGELLRAALGVPTTSGSGPYTHEFTFGSADAFSAAAARPPYSITEKINASEIKRYYGGQLKTLSLKQGVDSALMMDTAWILKGLADVADTVPVNESAGRFLFKHFAGSGASGAGNCEIVDFSMNIDNALETEEVLCGSDMIAGVDFGPAAGINMNMTLAFNTGQEYTDFINNSNVAWTIKWTKDANTELKLEIPSLNIEKWSRPVTSAGKIRANISAVANYDVATGYAMKATLKNAKDSYA